jgi:hypothetical protein
MTLEDVLSSQWAFLKFWRYTRTDFGKENVEFLVLVRAMNPVLGPAPYNLFPAGKITLEDRANYVYERCILAKGAQVYSGKFKDEMADTMLHNNQFVLANDPGRKFQTTGTRWGRNDTQINLPEPIQKALEAAKEAGPLTADAFIPAYNSIFRLVKGDTWVRFIKTQDGAEIAAFDPAKLAAEAIEKLRKNAAAGQQMPPVTFHVKSLPKG